MHERFWYYFYTEFELVCTDFHNEKVYQPDISGSCMIILPSDGQSVILDKGYQKHGLFAKERFVGNSLSASELFQRYVIKKMLWKYRLFILE